MILKKVSLICALLGITAVACLDIFDNKKDSENKPEVKPFKQGLVTTDWLSTQVAQENLVIVDVRSTAEFSSGGIPNSINIPFDVPISTWTALKGNLIVELPEFSVLSAKIAESGIGDKSQIVLVTNTPTTENPYSLSSPTRVALTLAYAGITNVAILDGGINKWVAEGKSITKNTKAVSPVANSGKENSAIFVNISYVKSNKGNAVVVDARDAEVYNGEIIEPWANKAGHIPGAVSLPAPLLWNTDGTYKAESDLLAIVKKVVGEDRNKEVIVYCGVGGYASTVWFVLTRILDYKNVKVFDGSSQEWALLYDMEK